MSHITEQLLLYAKTNPNSININRFKRINLTQMCKDYCLKTAPRVYAKGFEFAYESFDKDVFINADSILLESLLDNIISNALYYAVDEKNNPMGTISVNIKRHNNTIWLNVKDEGYGLNTKDLNHIFDRFYRVDSNKKGNGLGLSIVKQIAQLHNATVQASNDEGLVISIIFPL
jgi:two-component system sensor histidine kinase TctE